MARYIDADELYKAAQKRIAEANEARMAVVDDEFLDLINDAFTEDVAPRAEWISVEERLPDVCGMPVLMVAENEYGQTNVVKGFTGYTCPIDFCTNEIEYYSIWHAWKVTHWMPLPEPPKGN